MAKTLAVTAFRKSGNADFVRTYHHVTVPYDVTYDDIMRPGFWAHHATTLKKGDLLDILTEDDSLDMQARVTGTGIGMVFLRVLRDDPRGYAKAQPAQEQDTSAASSDELPDNYDVTFAPKHGWRVVLKNPQMIISKDHKSKAAAIAEAFRHSAASNAQVAA